MIHLKAGPANAALKSRPGLDDKHGGADKTFTNEFEPVGGGPVSSHFYACGWELDNDGIVLFDDAMDEIPAIKDTDYTIFTTDTHTFKESVDAMGLVAIENG